MRQKYPEDFDVKTAFTSAEMPFPIKEFVSHEEVENFKNEDLVLQALLDIFADTNIKKSCHTRCVL